MSAIVLFYYPVTSTLLQVIHVLLLLFLHVHTSTVPPTDWACSPSATRVTSSQPRAGQAGLPLNLFIPCHPRFPKWVSIPPWKTFYMCLPVDYSNIIKHKIIFSAFSLLLFTPCWKVFYFWGSLPLSSDVSMHRLAGNLEQRKGK